MPHHRRALVVAILAMVLGGAATAPQAAAATPLSLVGETLVAGANSAFPATFFDTSLASCNADLSGTFDFFADGVAAGPYPGTFTESGTVSVGPTTGSGPGTVISLHASFTIMADTGETITGTKDVLVAVTNNGTCFVDPFSYEVTFTSAVTYSATISTAAGSFQDSGTGHVQGDAANTFGFFLAPTGTTPFSAFEESFDTSNGVVPLSTAGHVTGGGWILGSTLNRVSFGFEVKSDSKGLHATCTVIDHSTRTMIRCLDADNLVVSGTHATFHGHATVNGVATHYTIDVDDIAEPGTLDTFKIVTDSGYAAAGTLMGGNIQIHKS